MVAANDQRHVGETTGFSMFDTHTHTHTHSLCVIVQRCSRDFQEMQSGLNTCPSE